MIDARFVAQLITFSWSPAPPRTTTSTTTSFWRPECFHEVLNLAFLAAVREPLTQALMPLLYFDFPFWYEERQETDLSGRVLKSHLGQNRSLPCLPRPASQPVKLVEGPG